MKKLISLVLLIVFFSVSVQAQYQPVSGRGFQYKGMIIDTSLGIPTVCGVPTLKDSYTTKSHIAFDSCNGLFYLYDPRSFTWITVTGSGTGSNIPDTIFAEIPLYVDTITQPGRRVLKLQHADGIVTPGIVTWSGSGLTFNVTSALFYINYRQYTTPSTSITLSPSDPSQPRIDLIGVDTNASVIKITGTAGGAPISPQTNPAAQLPLTTVFLNANDTIPSAVRLGVIYSENTEWTAAHTGTMSVNYNNTDNPYNGSKAAFVSSYNNGAALTFTHSVLDTVQSNEILKLYIYSNGPFTNTFQFQLFNGTSPVTNILSFNSGFGFNPLDSNTYQNVSIPLSSFTFSGSVFNKLVITMSGNDLTGAKGFYADYIQLQSGITNPETDYSNKVDSVTKIGSSIYYWVKGISHFITTLSVGTTVDTLPLHNQIVQNTAAIQLKLDSVRRKVASDSVFEYYSNATKRFAYKDSSGGSTTVTQSHTTGITVTIANTTTWLLVNPSALFATLAITMPALPSDGQKIEISFGGIITTGTVVTALTITANSGQALLQATAPTLVEAGETISYRYTSSSGKWYRIN